MGHTCLHSIAGQDALMGALFVFRVHVRYPGLQFRFDVYSDSTIDRDRLAIHNAEDAHLNGHGVVMMRTNHRAMKLNLF